MTWTAHDVGSANDFESGKPYSITVEGKALVLVRKGDVFYAMRDMCPHAGARFSDGQVIGESRCDKPGEEIDYCRIGEIISCPWHGWEFDVTTGKSLTRPGRIRVRTFPVRVERNRVLVETAA